MCRFAIYLGERLPLSTLVTEPVNSIIRQSIYSEEGSEPFNGDGFGLVWYAPDHPEEPALFRDVQPAWNDANLIHLARVTRSTCIFAHVRAATTGLPVTHLNCHPFIHGKFAFMHNGRVPGYILHRRKWLSLLSDEAFHIIQGSTDSEFAFALFTDHYRRLEDGKSPSEMIAEAMGATIDQLEELRDEAGIDEPCLLNFAVADGKCAAVTRYASREAEKAHSLYVHSGESWTCEDGVCHMIDRGNGGRAVIVASERLSEDPGWDKVPANTMIVIDEDHRVESKKLGK